MVRYFYAWTSLVIVGAVVFLSLPWLGLIALMIAALSSLAALGAFAWAMVTAPMAVGRAIGHRWNGQSAVPRRSAAMFLADRSAPSSKWASERRDG